MSILLVATGGTIASRPGPDGAVTTALSGDEVVATVTDIGVDDVEVVDVASVSSWNVEPDKRAEVAVMCRRALADGRADAVIVTHGTDTVEETAWLTELLAGRATARGPVVFTAAMRNAAALAADGPANLRDTILVARAPTARDRGVLLCANGEVHHARWVTKSDAHALDTFESPGAAPVGRVVAERVAFTLPSPPPPPPPPEVDHVEHHVALLPSYAGLDTDIVDVFVARGARGIVVEGTGAGNVYGGLMPGIERAIAAGIPVVVTTRCRTGAVAPIYGGDGGGARLAETGVILGGDLSAIKARLALMVALAGGSSMEAVRAWFAELVEPVAPAGRLDRI
ncbi:MAG: asparaginase [Acidimicrobiales bacterium]